MMTQANFLLCHYCGSSHTKKNGHNQSGSAQYHCFDCNSFATVAPKARYTEEQKQKIMETYLAQGSLRTMQKIFGVAPATLKSWIKQYELAAQKNRSVTDKKMNNEEQN